MPGDTPIGHPLHAQLIVLPAALLPFALAMDLMHRATGRASCGNAARHALAVGLAGGVAAGIAGALAPRAIPPGARTKRTADVHPTLNAAALAATAVNVALRARGADARDPLPLALSVAAGLGVLVPAWYGGGTADRQGVRAEGVDPLAQAPAPALPHDARITQADVDHDLAYGRAVGPALTPPADAEALQAGAAGGDRPRRVDGSEGEDEGSLPTPPASGPRTRVGTLPPF